MFGVFAASNGLCTSERDLLRIKTVEFLLSVTLVIVGILGHYAALKIPSGGTYACMTLGAIDGALSLFFLMRTPVTEKQPRKRIVPPQPRHHPFKEAPTQRRIPAIVTVSPPAAIDPPAKIVPPQQSISANVTVPPPVRIDPPAKIVPPQQSISANVTVPPPAAIDPPVKIVPPQQSISANVTVPPPVRIDPPAKIVPPQQSISAIVAVPPPVRIDPPVKWFDTKGVMVKLDLARCKIKEENHFKGDFSIPSVSLSRPDVDKMERFFKDLLKTCEKKAGSIPNVRDDRKDKTTTSVLGSVETLLFTYKKLDRHDLTMRVFHALWIQFKSEKQDERFFTQCLRLFTQYGQILGHCPAREVEVLHSIYCTYINRDDVIWNLASIRTKIASDVIDDLTEGTSETSATRTVHLRKYAPQYSLIPPNEVWTLSAEELNGDFATTFEKRYTFDRVARLFLNRFDGKILDYVQKHFTVERGDGSKGAPTKHDFLFGDYSWDMTGVALYFLAHDLITVDGQNPSDMKDQKS